MPIQDCWIDGRKGKRWGRSGKCYTGPNAAKLALRQAAAIRARQRTENARRLQPERIDPTRTATLRRRFESGWARRCQRLRAEVWRLVVTDDAFGLRPVVFHRRHEFRFMSSAAKVDEFERWLKGRIEADMFADGQDAVWTSYIEEGYRKGAGRAFSDTNRRLRLEAEAEGVADFYRGTKEEFLRASFARAETIDKVKLLASRTLMDLKGATDTMATQMRRELVDGLTQGMNPRELGRRLAKKVDGIGRVRGQMIARTEIIRAHAEGQLDALDAMGIEEVGVMVEWETVGAEACLECSVMQGAVFRIEEARGLIPRHPNCRCCFIPSNVGEPHRGQIRKPEGVREAIRESIQAERPNKPMGEAVERSSWVGVSKRIGERRPKSILASKIAKPG